MEKKYYILLIGRIHKIMPIYENEGMDSFYKYISVLDIELLGNDERTEMKQISGMIHGMVKTPDIEHELMRRVVLRCISLLDKMLTLWED